MRPPYAMPIKEIMNTPIPTTSDRELVISRIIHAPREHVFKA